MNDSHAERAGRSVFLTSYGQAGFRLAAGNSGVLIDPFLTDRDDRSYRPPAAAADFADVTPVLCTHEHADHLDLPIPRELCAVNPGATIVVPRPVPRSRPKAGSTARGWPARCRGRSCTIGT
jgi:L-ascorbate metabolism protein UlaG (beta-lactamase superfamily)